MARQRWRPTRRLIPVTTPAPGADWTQKNDSGGGWLVQFVHAQLVTSAVVANRQPAIQALNGTDVWFEESSHDVQGASGTLTYQTYPGSPFYTGFGLRRVLAWPTDGLWLPPGNDLRTLTALIDATDQWSAINLTVWEFPEAMPMNLIPLVSLYEDSDSE